MVAQAVPPALLDSFTASGVPVGRVSLAGRPHLLGGRPGLLYEPSKNRLSAPAWSRLSVCAGIGAGAGVRAWIGVFRPTYSANVFFFPTVCL